MWCIAVLSLLGLWYLLAWWSGLDPCTFDGWTNVLTHAAALPAFLAERRLRVQIGLYLRSLEEDVQILGRMCRHAGLQVLWNKGTKIRGGGDDGDDTKKTAAMLQKNMKTKE